MYIFKMKNIWYNTNYRLDVRTSYDLHPRKPHDTTSYKFRTGLGHQAGFVLGSK